MCKLSKKIHSGIIYFQLTASLLLVLTLGQLSLCSAEEVDSQAAWLDAPVTIEFSNENLSSALEKISNQTGISILYDEALANENVSASYYNVKAVEAINRLFAGKNKSLSFNDDKKAIIVKHFGAKGYVWAMVSQTADTAETVRGMTLADLEKLHGHQYKEYKKRLANGDEVLEGGMTRGELRSMHEEQYSVYKKRSEDNDEIIEGSDGLTRGELHEMHAKQQEDLQKWNSNENYELENGLTRAELKTIHQNQYKQYKQKSKDSSVILENGMKRNELQAMHKKQHDAHKEMQQSPKRVIN